MRTRTHWLKEYARKHGGTYTRRVLPSGMIIHTVKLSKRAMNPLLESLGSAALTGVGIGAGFKTIDAAWKKVFKSPRGGDRMRNPRIPHFYPGSFRKFEGKKFELVDVFTRKSYADNEWLRQKQLGYYARVVKLDNRWAVYRR